MYHETFLGFSANNNIIHVRTMATRTFPKMVNGVFMWSRSGVVRTSSLNRPQQTRNLIAAPTPGQGPLMERRADRALPSLSSSRRLVKTLPIFLGILTASCLAIFNYQKSSSSVVSSTLYALRTNPKAREILGDEIYFAHKIPWIWGEMNQLHGRIDIKFMVKGTKSKGEMRFKSTREKRLGYVCEWFSPFALYFS